MQKTPANQRLCCYLEYIAFSVGIFGVLTVFHSWLTYDQVKLVNFIVPMFAALIVGYLMAHNKVLQNQLTQLANTDKLTSAYNRQFFDQRLEEELDRAQRYDLKLSIIYLDLDHFKQVNDQHGHKIGDSVLIDFSRVVRKTIRESDIFARFGGEEFIVLAQMASSDSAHALYLRIKDAIDSHTFEVINNMTFSAGIAQLQKDETAVQILDRADKALYRAKENGRNMAIIAD